MQAIELHAQITTSHEIHLQLPHTIRAGTAKVIVMYDTPDMTSTTKRIFGQFRQQIVIDDTHFDDELAPEFWLGQPE